MRHIKSQNRLGCILIAIPLVLVVGSLLEIYRPWEVGYDNRPIPRRDEDALVGAFLWTLMENKTELAKTIVDESQWSRLDDWEQYHAPVGCNRWTRFPDEWTLSTVKGSIIDEDFYQSANVTSSIGAMLWWPCPNGDYQISTRVELTLTNEGWLVLDWDEVTEYP